MKTSSISPAFKDLGKEGNLLNILETKLSNNEFVKKIINYTPDHHGKNLGKGEIALTLFFDAIKEGKGDIRINNKELIEVKGKNSRFTTEEGPASGR